MMPSHPKKPGPLGLHNIGDLHASASYQARLVKHCLPWSGMSRIPASYESFAATHFQVLHAKRGTSWTDACPAYALAYLTHRAYGPVVDPGNSWELALQWEDLRGDSQLDWPEAFALVRQAWAYFANGTRVGGEAE